MKKPRTHVILEFIGALIVAVIVWFILKWLNVIVWFILKWLNV